MELSSYLEISGSEQGPIQGSSLRRGREDMIEVFQFNHCVEIPLGIDQNVGSGQATHRPLEVFKEVDRATPKLYQALCQRETLDKVRLFWHRYNQVGKEELYFSIRLQNARILRIQPWTPDAFEEKRDSMRFMERISFGYERIVWSWGAEGNVEYETDWFQRG
jgi:type VI secretion system secreted protein Hcp